MWGIPNSERMEKVMPMQNRGTLMLRAHKSAQILTNSDGDDNVDDVGVDADHSAVV